MDIKTFKKFLFSIAGAILLMSFYSFTIVNPAKEDQKPKALQQGKKNDIKGAWKMVSSGAPGETEMTVIKIITDSYFTNASYDKNGREFIGTSGGTYSLEGDNFSEIFEYFTWDSTKVGTTNSSRFKLSANKLELTGERDGKPFKETWEREDDFDKNTAPLAGTWRIRQRQSEPGVMSTMEWGPRKTLKILSNNRFQWIAFNVETKEFFGTGGGTYTSKDGKYIETLEFFSRDPQRVGAQLTFDFEVKENSWHHKGKSSTGNEIYEIWERVDQPG